MSTETIRSSILIFEHLRTHNYKITVEDFGSFILKFRPEHFHHLAGFQHLTDMQTVVNPPRGKERFYRALKNESMDGSTFALSAHYDIVQRRLESFQNLCDILESGNTKVIVEFDRQKANSDIVARFMLYKLEGIPFQSTVTYYNLFLGYDPVRDEYYPATFIVEESKKYVSGQTILDCKIEMIPKFTEQRQTVTAGN